MKTLFQADGSVIVITGGANGIGRALALACAEAGAIVVVCDLDAAAGSTLAASHPNIEFQALDVGDRAAVFQCFAAIEARHGAIDGLVCGAAIQPRIAVADTPEAVWRQVMEVNLNGVVWCYQAAIGGMRQRRRGAIVAFSSGLAASGYAGAAAYATTKAALNAFVRSAAKEVASDRVRFNLIAPGVIDTPQYRAANPGADNAHWARTTGIGGPEDVVGPLMFLLSDAATMTASLLSRDFAYAAADDARSAAPSAT